MSIEIKMNMTQMQAAMQTIFEKAGFALQHVAEQAHNKAREMSPLLTGTNKRSITLDFKAGRAPMTHENEDGKPIPSGIDEAGISLSNMKSNDIGFRIYTQSGYGGWLELGTSRMAARPYIKPGFEYGISQVERELSGIL